MEPIAAKRKVTALPIASKGAYQYQPDMPETEDLPPHRAAVPVHANFMAHTAAVRRRYVIALSVAFSLALHGGFFAAAMVWGQGEPLPETADGVSATIQIQVTQEHIRETIAAKPMAEPAEGKVEVLRIETVPFGAETPLVEGRKEAAEVQHDVAPAEAPANDAAVAEAASDADPPAPAEDDAAVAQQEAPATTPDHIQPTVAVVTPPPVQTAPEPPQQVEAAATADTREESYLPPIPTAGRPPDASQETAEQSQPRRKRGRRAESGATASVAPDDGKPRGARRGSASRVALFAYKRRIRARVMRNLPQGQWGAGRVVIGLRMSRWGQLLRTHVAKSSGSAMIDQAALNCVRMSGPYPRPPAGATSAQLALSMDFRFE